MKLDTVIFDMDGLLVDSEPLWAEVTNEVFKQYGITLSHEQYVTTTGLRTPEFVQWWFSEYKISLSEVEKAGNNIIELVTARVAEKAAIMPGVHYLFDFFHSKQFKIGLATSSPKLLIDEVLRMTGIRPYLQAIASAEFLPYGKPHPQVYLNCAEKLASNPSTCICFEDSFNGMLAAKSARMKCVVVPHHSQQKEERWGAADLKLSSLQNFGPLHFNLMNS